VGQELSNLMSITEAAEQAEVARNTMLLAAKSGKIKAVRLGRDWFVDATDIERWKQDDYRPNMARHDSLDDNSSNVSGEPDSL